MIKLKPGVNTLLNTQRSIALCDLVVSKQDNARLTIRAGDKDVLFIDQNGTFSFSWYDTLIFQKEISLMAQNDSDGDSLVTLGYFEVDQQQGGENGT